MAPGSLELSRPEAAGEHTPGMLPRDPDMMRACAECANAMRQWFAKHGLQPKDVLSKEDGPADVRDSFWRSKEGQQFIDKGLLGHVRGDEELREAA